jgi:hypothetical protein
VSHLAVEGNLQMDRKHGDGARRVARAACARPVVQLHLHLIGHVRTHPVRRRRGRIEQQVGTIRVQRDAWFSDVALLARRWWRRVERHTYERVPRQEPQSESLIQVLPDNDRGPGMVRTRQLRGWIGDVAVRIDMWYLHEWVGRWLEALEHIRRRSRVPPPAQVGHQRTRCGPVPSAQCTRHNERTLTLCHSEKSARMARRVQARGVSPWLRTC